MKSKPFEIYKPDHVTGGVVFASPHSGRNYPAQFLSDSILDERTIRSSEDAYVDRLYDMVPQFGVPLICAHAPRAYLDLNRASDELDAALIQGLKRKIHDARVASGLGVIPRVVAGGRPIYCGKISAQEAENRIQAVWLPYHAALQGLLQSAYDSFGYAILIDCHSMPREAVVGERLPGGVCPDVILGDRFGNSAGEEIVDVVHHAFETAGLHVARNIPFAGAYTTRIYGKPAKGIHVLQIEIDRSLYMNEATLELLPSFKAVKSILTDVVAQITAYRPSQTLLAAE